MLCAAGYTRDSNLASYQCEANGPGDGHSLLRICFGVEWHAERKSMGKLMFIAVGPIGCCWYLFDTVISTFTYDRANAGLELAELLKRIFASNSIYGLNATCVLADCFTISLIPEEEHPSP